MRCRVARSYTCSQGVQTLTQRRTIEKPMAQASRLWFACYGVRPNE